MKPKVYSKLVGNETQSGLLYAEEIQTNNIVVARDLNNKGAKDFLLFNDYMSLCQFMCKIKDRNLYEVNTKKHLYCKMAFDIDMEINDGNKYYNDELRIDSLLLQLMRAILTVSFEYKLNINVNEIMFFTSSNETKESYHVIIDNHVFLNSSKDRETFYSLCLAQIDSELRKHVDSSIYSLNHCLRIVANAKFGSTRYKRFTTGPSYSSIFYRYIYEDKRNDVPFIVQHSLLTTFYDGIIIHKDTFSTYIPYYSPQPIDSPQPLSESIEEVMQLVRQKFGSKFEVYSINNNVIWLTNKYGYKCQSCNRIHDHMSPSIRLYNDQVYFFCNRGGKGLKLGYINSISEEFLQDYFNNYL